jgi:hypothetical protein
MSNPKDPPSTPDATPGAGGAADVDAAREGEAYRRMFEAVRAGENEVYRSGSDRANPHPEGSSIFCAWQGGFWGAKSHDERVRILRLLVGPDLDRGVEYDPVEMVKALAAERDALRAAVEEMRARKDGAYEERNRVVALLAALARLDYLRGPWDACRSRTAIEGWSDDWHGCVYVKTPQGQLSWHYHDSHAGLFGHLPFVERHPWDGHTTEEKYARIERLTGTALAAADGAGEAKP